MKERNTLWLAVYDLIATIGTIAATCIFIYLLMSGI